MSGIERILVIGAGAMGSQIAMVCALSGYTTALVDISQESLDRARDQLHARMTRDVAKGRRNIEDVDGAWSRLAFSAQLEDAAADVDLVIEAAVEDIAIKRSIFAQLDAAAPQHTILATNSSNIVSSKVADATTRPERVCNMHFFNPALVMACVEVVPNPQTTQETVEAVVGVVRQLGKSPVVLHREIPGFVANRILQAIRKEALELYTDGVASFEDIDVAAKTALRHPMGPFELMDLVGIDVAYLIRQAEFEQTGDESSLPHPLLKEKFEAGDFGQKTGKGWYTYDKPVKE